jgi:hypothetical protein
MDFCVTIKFLYRKLSNPDEIEGFIKRIDVSLIHVESHLLDNLCVELKKDELNVRIINSKEKKIYKQFCRLT